MRNKLVVSMLAVTAIFAMSAVVRSQTARQPVAATARAASSVPDLSGKWIHDPRNRADVAPGQAPRPYMYFTKEPIPMLPWARSPLRKEYPGVRRSQRN